MLQDGHVYAKLPAGDTARARRFYVETLGFEPTSEWEGHMRFDCADGSTFLVFPSSGRPSGDHDQCGWLVDDIEAEVADLRRRGITFEEFPGDTYVDGIRADANGWAAWFRDSEGNLLNVRSLRPRGT